MKTSRILALTLIIVCVQFPLLSESVTFNEAKRLSAETGKNIFVNYTASWCVPCQTFKASVLSDDKVIELLDTEFIVVDADWDDDTFKSTFENYKVCCLPTLHVLNSEGGILAEIPNTSSKKEFYTLLSKYKRGMSYPDPLPTMVHASIPYSDRTGTHTVQAGAFSSYENATRQKNKIEGLVNVEVYIVTDNTRGLHMVHVGDDSPNNLRQLIQQLSKSKIDSFLKRKI